MQKIQELDKWAKNGLFLRVPSLSRWHSQTRKSGSGGYQGLKPIVYDHISWEKNQEHGGGRIQEMPSDVLFFHYISRILTTFVISVIY